MSKWLVAPASEVRTLSNVVDGCYVPPRFLDRVTIHIVKNHIADTHEQEGGERGVGASWLSRQPPLIHAPLHPTWYIEIISFLFLTRHPSRCHLHHLTAIYQQTLNSCSPFSPNRTSVHPKPDMCEGVSSHSCGCVLCPCGWAEARRASEACRSSWGSGARRAAGSRTRWSCVCAP